LALAKLQYGISYYSKPEYVCCICHAGKFDKSASKRWFNKGFIENGLSTWMAQETIQTSQLSIPFYKNSTAHGIDSAEQIRMEWWPSINENWLNVKINLDANVS